MTEWRIFWSSGRVSGTLLVFAPDAATALATVEANPSKFGIPFEHPLIGCPTWNGGERRRGARAA
jgi:hypothetical protein